MTNSLVKSKGARLLNYYAFNLAKYNNNINISDFFRCAQNMIKKDEHDRKLESRRQKEEQKAAQHRREIEADQQKHRQELEQEEHQKMLALKEIEQQKMLELKEKEQQKELELKEKEKQKELELKEKEKQKELELKEKEQQKELELKEKTQADIEKESNHRQVIERRRQDETERGCQHQRELQMKEIKMNGELAMAQVEARKAEAEAEARKAEAEARKAEAKAKEASSVARAAEAKMKYAEVEAKIKIAKTKEREMEHRSMLWKKYFDPETKMQDKQLIVEEIKRLQTVRISDRKAPIVVKENKAPKSKGNLEGAHLHRPWMTTMF